MSEGQNSTDVDEARKCLLALAQHAKQSGHADALGSAASKVGISRWSAWNLVKKRRKSIPSEILGSIRRAYLRLVERQLRHLEAEVSSLRERCGEDDDIRSLGAETARLVERLRQARDRQG